MRLNLKALAITLGILWGGSVLFAGIANQVAPPYGGGFLDIAASLYPGTSGGGWGSVLLGTVYGLADGAICGALIAWLYNRVAGAA